VAEHGEQVASLRIVAWAEHARQLFGGAPVTAPMASKPLVAFT
jgi:hypothetical protein